MVQHQRIPADQGGGVLSALAVDIADHHGGAPFSQRLGDRASDA
jgi:hypothetical protein